MMKIFYDYQILLTQRFGGISRYFFELINRITMRNDNKVTIIAFGSINHYFEAYFNRKARRNNNRIVEKICRGINKVIALIQLKRNYDIIHPTYYNDYYLKNHKGKLVITVYDMIQEVFPDQFPQSIRDLKRNVILGSDHIIAISESTKNDIIRFIPEIEPSKITVIYLSSNICKYQGNELRSRFPKKYCLFVGQRFQYKNFINFREAMKRIMSNDSDINVVCVGGGAFSNEEIDSFGVYKNRFIQFTANDELLSAAYTFADCFVFPSKYEGFGIPTLEAFACDCPVVLSNTSSMPEVGGDAVEYCNPDSVDSIFEAIYKVLYVPNHKEKLIANSRIQREKFNWELIAEQTLECYKRTINS